MSSLSMREGNDHDNADCGDNSSVSVIMNNDVNLNDKGNLLWRTSFVDHDDVHYENNSIASDDDINTVLSKSEDNSSMSYSTIDGVNYHAEKHFSTSSVVDDNSNGNTLKDNIYVNAPIADNNVQCVKENRIEIVTREDQLLIRLTALCCDMNVPLYIANDIVEIFCQEVECG